MLCQPDSTLSVNAQFWEITLKEIYVLYLLINCLHKKQHGGHTHQCLYLQIAREINNLIITSCHKLPMSRTNSTFKNSKKAGLNHLLQHTLFLIDTSERTEFTTRRTYLYLHVHHTSLVVLLKARTHGVKKVPRTLKFVTKSGFGANYDSNLWVCLFVCLFVYSRIDIIILV